MNSYVDEYFDYLKNIKCVSTNTYNSYKHDIEQYIEYLNSISENNITSVTSTIILNYLLKIQQEGKSSATASRHLASIRALYKHLCQKGYLSTDPTYELKSFKAERRPPQALTDIQIEMFLDMPECTSVKGYRDKAILEVMYATGMRASDLITINLKDVNLKIGYIYCRNNKKERIIPIYAYARECLQDYIEKRALIKNSEKTDYLFLNLNGSPLSRQGLWKIIKYYQHKMGIPIEITPHTLRHSFAIHLLENGADLKSVQELMGHTDISSTQIYEQVVKNKLSEVYTKAHPRSKHRK